MASGVRPKMLARPGTENARAPEDRRTPKRWRDCERNTGMRSRRLIRWTPTERRPYRAGATSTVEAKSLSDGVLGFALIDVARFDFAGFALAGLAGLEAPVSRGDVLAQAGCLHEEVIHRMAVITVGFR